LLKAGIDTANGIMRSMAVICAGNRKCQQPMTQSENSFIEMNIDSKPAMEITGK
jgi:hypothetical protein